MIFKAFNVYDSKVEAYNTPFFLRHKGEALRSFEEIANDKSSAIGKHPGDFTLFEIGTYNELTGELACYESKINLGCAIELVRQNKTGNISLAGAQ